MIPTPQELLITLMNDWKNDLAVNLAKQEALKADEARLRAIVETCERAAVLLFPPPEPTPEEEENGPT